MNSQEEPQLKYSYRFRVEAKKPGLFDDEEQKSEVRLYINELLGVKESTRDKNRVPTG